jgi:hypothetical protein
MVLDAVSSPHSKRNYAKALDHLFQFCASRPLSRSLLMEWRAAMESLSPSTINVRLSEVRKLVGEARRNNMIGQEEAPADRYPQYQPEGNCGHRGNPRCELRYQLGRPHAIKSVNPDPDAITLIYLAAIFNSDSEFIFAVDSSRVEVDDSGAISLIVDIGVQGNKSSLLRFSYHVQILSDPVDTMISGTIRWREAIASPSAAAQAGQPIFKVDTGVAVLGSGESLGGLPQFQVARTGFSVGVPIRAGGFWASAYQIHDVPLGTTYKVIPALLPNQLVNLPPGANVNSFEFVTTQSVQLTLAIPTAIGVDFEMVLHQGPR